MAIESSNLETVNMRRKYDESYSFFNFKFAQNEGKVRRKMCNKTLSNSSLAPIKFKRMQTLCSHLTLVSDLFISFHFIVIIIIIIIIIIIYCYFRRSVQDYNYIWMWKQSYLHKRSSSEKCTIIQHNTVQ
jgi:hypothetical protein